jgi:hypothetical protein
MKKPLIRRMSFFSKSKRENRVSLKDQGFTLTVKKDLFSKVMVEQTYHGLLEEGKHLLKTLTAAVLRY